MYFTTLTLLSASIFAPVQGLSIVDLQLMDEAETFPRFGRDSEQFKKENQAIDRLVASLEKYALPSVGTSPGKAYYPLGPVRFTMLPINSIRETGNLGVSAWHVVFKLYKYELNITTTNENLQALVFERVLGDDLGVGSNILQDTDTALKTAYGYFYNRNDGPPTTTDEHRSQLDFAVRALLLLKMHLVSVFHFETLYPNIKALNMFSKYLQTTVLDLKLSPYTQVPEERLIFDILRALLVVVHPAATLFKSTLVREHDRQTERVYGYINGNSRAPAIFH